MVFGIEAYLVVVVLMSLASFVMYGFDKHRAVRGGRRVPERTLHVLAFLGGWPGALIAQRQFRHKTQKTSFRIVFWLVVVTHMAIVGGVSYAIVNRLRNVAHGTFPIRPSFSSVTKREIHGFLDPWADLGVKDSRLKSDAV